MFSRLLAVLALAILAVPGMPSAPTFAQIQVQSPGMDYSARLKDIADFEGVRDNVLVGYGLVVGLNRTGDTITNSVFTRQSLLGMLDRLGVNAKDAALKTQNTAAVIVTATLPPFARPGSRVDIVVSALGDAKSLLGGTLLVTALLGADGEVYAVAQGPLAVGGFSAEGAGASVTRGVPTSARIPNGAIIERSVGFALKELRAITLALRAPDFTTAMRVSATVNAFAGREIAETLDPGTVRIGVPGDYPGGVVALMTDIERLTVIPDQQAKVVINEENGVIVINQDVKIAPVAIAQGSLTVRITETPQVSQPSPFSRRGDTVVVPRTDIQVTESGTGKIAMLSRGASLRDLVNGLNALGVSPRDLIGILQTLKSAGALRADLEVR